MNISRQRILTGFLFIALIASGSGRAVASDASAPATMGPNSLHLSSDPEFLSTFYNPALLGTDYKPGWFFFLPFSDLDAGVWNDKLKIPFTNSEWRKLVSNGDDYISPILNASFDLKNKDAPQTSQILSDGLKDGVNFCTHVQLSPICGYFHGVAFDVQTNAEQQLHLPGAIFQILFSENNGLQSGNTLDFSDFSENVILSTDVRFAYGRPFTPPSFVEKYLHLSCASWGVGASYVMGHALVEAAFDSGKVTDNRSNNSFDIDGTAHVITAGTGLHGEFGSGGSIPGIAGNGGSVDGGLLLYSQHAAFGLSVSNLGMIAWNNVKEATMSIHQHSLSLDDMIEGKQDSLFDPAKGNYLSGRGDSLKSRSAYMMALPAVLDASYSYTWDFSSDWTKWLADYVTPEAHFRQYFVSGPCVSLTPTVEVGAKAGVLGGILPLYYGISVGGSQGTTSTLCAGFDFRKITIYAVVKAIGSLDMNPDRGFEAAFCIKANPGF